MLTRCGFSGDLYFKNKKVTSWFENFTKPKYFKYVKKYQKIISIGVLHYKEDINLIVDALKSIDNQKKINWDLIEVFIITDGGGDKLNEEKINNSLKHFQPKFIYRTAHESCGGSRNELIRQSNAYYVMSIDGDDVLCNNNVLHNIIKKIIKYEPDLYYSSFYEETDNHKYNKYSGISAFTMCHGKVYNKDFLINNNLWFDTSCKVCEDLDLNVRLYNLSNHIYFDNKYTYIWRYNPKSILRSQITDNKETDDASLVCFDRNMELFNEWYKTFRDNRFVTEKFLACTYNIYYIVLCLTKFKSKDIQEKYFKKYFTDYVILDNIDFDFADLMGKQINKHLFKHFMLFSEAYKKYHIEK